MDKIYMDLGFPSASKLYLAAKRRGIPGTKEDAQKIANQDPIRQTNAPVARSLGKAAAEEPTARW